MGLDQYLYANKYVSDSKWIGAESNAEFDSVVTAMGAKDFMASDSASAQVQIKVAYWRKCNQIHNWFVENCQGGVDDCRESHVSREQLMELVDLCGKVLANNDDAHCLLPSQGGFFFGSTDYDEWYFNDIKETVEQLSSVLKNTPDGWDFIYQSSW